MHKHILLISYTFPPYPGIGGRRWAKFAKYLAQKGFIVHVICAKNPFDEVSLWNDDVKHENIKVYELNTCYPAILLKHPKSIIEKIYYKFALYYVSLFSKGTPYDKGIFWKKSLLNLSVELITKFKINNTIVSCTPFSSSYQAIELKTKFPKMKFLVDFRDPWTWGTGYGYSTISNVRKQFEKKQEENVLAFADVVFVPSIEMKEHLNKSYLNNSKACILSHAFDENDFELRNKIESRKIEVLFYGTLYPNLEDVFKKLASFISLEKDKIKLDIFSSTKKYSDFFEENNLMKTNVNYYTSERPLSLFRKMSNYNYVLVVQPDYAKDFITTKIFEIIYSKTPIILISNGGKLAEFIKSNNLGFCFNSKELDGQLHNIVNTIKPNFSLEKFPINKFSFNTITEELISNLID